MEKVIKKGKRCGEVILPSSKSAAHRALICAALTKGENKVVVKGISKDILATASCLNALFNNVKEVEDGFLISSPVKIIKNTVELFCGESGTTLRLILPLVGVFGIKAVFCLEGRLQERPIDDLASILVLHGMSIIKEGNKIKVGGKLSGGEYQIKGDISSQYISALLFSLPLIEGENTLKIIGDIKSKSYIEMTKEALSLSGVDYKQKENVYRINGKCEYSFPAVFTVEADWSAASAFAFMGAVSKSGVTLKGLSLNSGQGDKKIIDILEKMGAIVSAEDNDITIKSGKLAPVKLNADEIIDAVPTLAAFLSGVKGKSEITGCKRLKYKESNRLLSTTSMLKHLGADITSTDDTIFINGKEEITGGKTTVFSDHRIAFAAAVAALFSKEDVLIDDAECVKKSYVDFWKDFESLKVEK
ncbi:MAG: 3-phosphoshikimate 1-carboxyvinyltransferase [Clostridia bacterium]|nr:3-phosphoshikimate 1-carboxyvinyltransferase [Clostridia bacterium]